MTEPVEDPTSSRALMRAYLQQRRSEGELSSRAFLQARPGVDDALRGWLQAAESWSDDEIELRLQKLDDESAGIGNTVPIERTEAFDRTMPLDPGEHGGIDEPPVDGRYRIVRVVGEGGCGKVYLVEDLLQDNELLALKVVRTDLADSDQFEQRFRNEIRVLRALSHPRIPQIFNDGKTPDGDIYYTMSYVAGVSLADILDDEAPLDATRIVGLVRQIIEVLEYAHAKGVVHRDLKPSNIMILEPGSPDEQVRVLDFGIAKILTREGGLENAKTMQTMAMLGTPHYMSPEQVSGQPIDPSTDIYALGVIVYQMCSGKLPFTGGAVMELLTARLRSKPPQLANDEIPAWLRKLVSQLLEMEGRKRPSTQQIHAIFERGMQAGTKAAHKHLLALGAAGLLAVIGIYSLYSMVWSPSDPEDPGGGFPAEVANLVPAPGSIDVSDGATEQPNSDEPGSSGVDSVPNPLDGTDPDRVGDLASGPGTDGAPSADIETDADEPDSSEPVIEPIPVLESVTFTAPEPNLVTNLHSLSVSGTCTPALEFDLAIGMAEETQRTIGRSAADGGFDQRISLPPGDGTYTLVVEAETRRIGELEMRIDRSAPRALEVARLLKPGPFAYEDGPIQAQFRFDEPVVLLSADGRQCDELPWGSGVADFPLPAVDSAEPEKREVTLRAADALGNESEFVITVSIFSAALASLAKSNADDLDSFTFTTDSSEFPPRIGYDVEAARFLIPDARGVSEVWELPDGIELMERVEALAPFHVFGVDSGSEKTRMVLVCGSFSNARETTPFLIDQREVDWKRYEVFIQDSADGSRSYREDIPIGPDDVVGGVQWRDADAFAGWSGKQLPSAAQWETAAAWNGNALQRFAWGPEFQPAAIAVRRINEIVQASDAGLDISPWGVLGMGAGVREWIADMPSDRSRRLARGGTSYARVPFGFTLADDYKQSPSTYNDRYGVTTAEKSLRLLETSANLKDVGLRCIIPLIAR